MNVAGKASADLNVPMLPGTKLGKNWLLIGLNEVDLNQMVEKTDRPHSEYSFYLPGFAILDGRRGWVYDPDEKCVRYIQKALPISVEDAWFEKRFTGRALVLKEKLPANQKMQLVQSSAPVEIATDRAVIGTQWIKLKIVSDVFIVNTARGYTPTIYVYSHLLGTQHLFVGAKSIAIELENIRKLRGALVDAEISIRKKTSDEFSQFQLRLEKGR